MKEENSLVISSLTSIAVLSFFLMGYLAWRGVGLDLLNQIVLIPVSVVSGFVGYLTKGAVIRQSEPEKKEPKPEPKNDRSV